MSYYTGFPKNKAYIKKYKHPLILLAKISKVLQYTISNVKSNKLNNSYFLNY